mgnify:CR=1 FL=1
MDYCHDLVNVQERLEGISGTHLEEARTAGYDLPLLAQLVPGEGEVRFEEARIEDL